MKRAMLCAALGAAVLAGATTTVRAEEGQMRVALSGLDLNTVAGAKVALSRIHASADVFCDDVAGRQSLERQAVVQQCIARMTWKSVDALHAPIVTALLEHRPVSEAAVAVAQK